MSWIQVNPALLLASHVTLCHTYCLVHFVRSGGDLDLNVSSPVSTSSNMAVDEA